MNEENKNLEYDFNFENQVDKTNNEKTDSNSTMETIDTLDEEVIEEISESTNENIADDVEQLEEITEEVESKQDISNQQEVKKVKLFGKEFNYEDIILALIGIIIFIVILLLPKITTIF